VYALRKTFDIAAANMSLGGGTYTATCDASRPGTKAAIDNLVTARIATVIASGNSYYTNAMGAPGCISTAISVGSTTKADVVSDFSNAASFLKLLAPGSAITSSIPGGGYESWYGTSMATPHVTGAWALLEDKAPALTVAQGLTALQNTGLSILDSRNGLTFKRIRVMNALNSITGLPAATLLTPKTTGVTLTPTFLWNKVSASTRYRIMVQKMSGGTPPIDATYNAGDVCGATTCSLVSPVTLAQNTQYNWWVQTYQFGTGPWSAAKTFTTGTLPAKPTLTTPTGTITTLTPMYEWNKVTGATSYQLFIQPAAGGTAVLDKEFSAASVCESALCHVTPARTLTKGTEYRFRVRARNAVGYGTYSAYNTFTPSSSLPGEASLISPEGALNHQFPTYKWNKTPSTTRYYLSVRQGTTILFTNAYLASDVCGVSTCEATPVVPMSTGSYSWRLQTRNGTGYGPYSAWKSFSTVETLLTGVLQWGADPANLDLHLLTPSGHVSPGAPNLAPYAIMTASDSNGSGPEIIQVLQYQSGTYQVFVRRVAGTGPLAGSGATLKLYFGDGLVASATVPASGAGDYWNVCTVTYPSVTCPNVIQGSAPGSSTGSKEPGGKD